MRNMYKINIPRVHIKKIIYVPMIAPKLTIEESLSYEKRPLNAGLTGLPMKQTINGQKNPAFTMNKK